MAEANRTRGEQAAQAFTLEYLEALSPEDAARFAAIGREDPAAIDEVKREMGEMASAIELLTEAQSAVPTIPTRQADMRDPRND